MKVDPGEGLYPAGNFDLILCRNRMIYYRQDNCRQLTGRLCDKLPGGAYFIIGVKESGEQLGLKDNLEIIHPDLKIYKNTG
jgi:chemotaxis methyl-accepting protein methylase